MPRDKTTPGASITDRLLARSKRAPLSRRSMPGGGEVFEGPLASRALKALGARAMTVDSSIVVGEGFDPSRPESQALYAHEQVHQQGSGGAGSHVARAPEEVVARRAERMVLHRAAEGGTEAGAALAGGSTASPPAGENAGAAGASAPNPERGYQALAAQGMTHDDIVAQLTKACLDNLDQQQQTSHDRFGDLKGG